MGIAIPGQLGELRYNPETRGISIDWPDKHAENLKMIELAKFMHEKLDKANKLPPTQFFFPPNPMQFTGHPLGGAVIGRACDLFGRVYGYPGLYVVDSALLPGSAAVCNPSFTVTALAERAMETLVPEVASAVARAT
jgi:cholesterol oxidase